MERILVVAAVRQELDPFLRRSNGDVQVLLTGVGARRAYAQVGRWLSDHPCGGLISAGFAGATRPGLKTGDLIWAEEVVDAVSGERARPSFSKPSLGGVASGRLVTVPRAAWSPSAKAALGARFEAVAVDMETAWVARAAGEKGIPWVAIRAVLDPMEQFLFGLGTLLRGVPVARECLSAYLKAVIPSLRST